MDGNALEVALGLIRHPANRAPLRLRPLPEGVGERIELAAGVPARMAEASTLSGEPPHQVREAARFYVREVLLFPDADAYRVLGVSETASAAQIKRHYRLLQHWLHPDRRGNDWESALAIRINQAWGDLRSPGRRAAYDARRGRPGVADDGSEAKSFVVDGWRPLLWHSAPSRGWLLPATAVTGCLALALLVALREEAPPPSWGMQAKRAAEPARQSLADGADSAMESMRERLSVGRDTVEPVTAARPSVTDAPQPARYSAPQHIQEPLVPPRAARAAPVPLDTRLVPIEDAAPRPVTNGSSARDVAPASAAEGGFTEARDSSLVIAATPALTPSFERVRLARERGRQLIKHLSSASDLPPALWNNIDALDEASALRQRLHAAGPQTFRQVRFSDPEWRITSDRASMTSTIRRLGQSAALRVDLVWRDGAWLVDRIQADGL